MWVGYVKQSARITSSTEPQAGCDRRLPTTPLSASSKESYATIPLPPLPYLPGACFDIKAHNAPPPFDGGGSYFTPDPKEWDPDPWPMGEGAPSTIVEQYLGHPPRKTSPPFDQVVRRLKVTQQIRCGDHYNAQLVRCCVDGGNDDLVAKIFDPLYIRFEKCEDNDRSRTYFTEWVYSCEAAAYVRIKEGGLDSNFTPSFKGCWVLEFPLYDAKGCLVAHREVRLILQTFIPGNTIRDLVVRGEATKIDPKVRMDLLDRIMEAHSQLIFIGVHSNDLRSRNYVVTRVAEDRWRVTLIDFSHSRVRDLPNSKWHTQPELSKRLPESPITIFWNSLWPPVCKGWIPKEYNCRTKESLERRVKWVRERWEKSGDYEPVDKEQLREMVAYIESGMRT